jgi:hypothetical protein
MSALKTNVALPRTLSPGTPSSQRRSVAPSSVDALAISSRLGAAPANEGKSAGSDVGSEGSSQPPQPAAASSSDETVKVICRIRPFNDREIQLHQQSLEGKPQWEQLPIHSVMEFHGNQCVFLDHERDWNEKERFTFDSCLWSIPDAIQASENPFATQESLFETYGHSLLDAAWKGFNSCFFAYGQTGSGKTHSMMGDLENDPGLTPRLCKALFDQVEENNREAEKLKDTCIKTFRVEVKYMEIYNEMIKDLLWPLTTLSAEAKAKLNPDNLKIRGTPQSGFFVDGLTSIEVEGWQKMMELIELGSNSRTVAATKMNERSSRSHAVFKISLTQLTTSLPKKQFEKPTEHMRTAFINLVDLAGSERNKKTGATGDRLKEAASINKSLMCLKNVIDALVDNSLSKSKKPIPYRDSHLTSLLMDSLGGNAKTYMLVCVSPHVDNAEESLQTLKYGARARQIINTVHVNENASSRLMLDLEGELERMKADLEKNQAEGAHEAIETLKVQIKEHEASIGKMEAEMQEQQEKLRHLQEEQKKELNQRHAHALANLSAVTQARLKRDEAESEERRLRKELQSVVDARNDFEAKRILAEKETIRLYEEAETHKKQRVHTEEELETVKRRQAKLESYKRELQKNVEDGEKAIKVLKSERFGTILRARLMIARLNLDFRRKVEDQRYTSNEQMRKLSQEAQAKQLILDAEHNKKLTELQKEREALRQQLDAVHADTAKLEEDKSKQINQLKKDVDTLQQENRRKKEHMQVRIAQATADYDKKFRAMVEEMELSYKKVVEEWQTRHLTEVQREQDELKACTDKWQLTLCATQEAWEQKLASTKAEGEMEYQAAQKRWSDKFEEKQRINQGLLVKLQEIHARNEKYSDLHHRISAVMDTFKAPTASSSAEYCELYAAMKTFYAEYEQNRPPKSKLEQLLKADWTHPRCSQAPLLASEQSGSVSPTRRSKSPVLSFRAPSSPGIK